MTDFDAVNADPVLTPDDYMPPERFISNYAISERTVGGYVQLNMDGDWGALPVRGNVGVRVVGTDQTSNGFLADGTPLTQSQDYQDVLPSANLVFQVSDAALLRVAASRSLTRPTLSALSPGGIIAPTGLTARLGNPELNPFSANQVDASFEWYFTNEALASVTYFFKDVDGFITNVATEGKIDAGELVNDLGEDVSNATFLVTRPVNGEAATIQGVEASFQTPFSFLPAPFDGLGALANFTFADSQSTIEFNDQLVTTLLPGQSRSSYNLVGYYEKGPFSGRVVYSWRDDYLDQVRPSQSQRSNFIADYGQLDMSLQYDLAANLAVTFDALNLLEAEEQRYGEWLDRNVRYTEWGRFVLFGIKVNY